MKIVQHVYVMSQQIHTKNCITRMLVKISGQKNRQIILSFILKTLHLQHDYE